MPTDRPDHDDPEGLLRHARAELRRLLDAGLPSRAETFLEAFPALAADPARALELVLAEFELRLQRGETPSPEEWLRRFPQYEAELRRRFAADVTLTINSPTQPLTPRAAAAAERGVPALGRLELLGRLGQGGMGVVYKARDPVLDRLVALKTLRTGALATPAEVERFYTEARAAAQLRHPHLVPILAVGLYDGQLAFTMPLITGGSLEGRADEYHADPRRAVALMEKVARAVAAAHQRGVIHRDLKPGNILLDEAGEPLVADFGVAKLAGATAEMTVPGQVVGTPAYMPPEQAAGRNAEVSPASDVWSLGVILYRLLTGQRPFPAQSSHEVVQQILTEEPPPPRALRPDLPRDLQAVLLKCLEKEPARRYPTAGALADDLQCWLRGEPVSARPPSRGRRLLRVLRRRPVASGVLAGAACLLAVAPVARHFADPDREVAAQQRQLARGRAVTLLGPAGKPARLSWLAGEGAVLESPDTEGAFTFHAMHLAYLLLLPDPMAEHFVLRADVRHLDGDREAGVGVFALHAGRPDGNGREHSLCDLTFSDRHGRPREAVLKARCFRGPEFARRGNFTAGPLPRPLEGAAPAPGQQSPWHRLTLEVAPDKVVASLDGAPVGVLERPYLRQVAPVLVEGLAGPPPTFPPRGGLGLCVYRGAASFRNVVIEPRAGPDGP